MGLCCVLPTADLVARQMNGCVLLYIYCPVINGLDDDDDDVDDLGKYRKGAFHD